MEIPQNIGEIAARNYFEVKHFKFDAPKEELRPPRYSQTCGDVDFSCVRLHEFFFSKFRIIRVGLIQNSIVLQPNNSVQEQKTALHDRIETIIDTASKAGVNIICLQEAWSRYSHFTKKFHLDRK